MNERIKELADQAESSRLEYNSYTMMNNRIQEFDKEKFAKLIVQECVRHFNEDYQRDFDTLWREDLSKSIKQHFGVEE